MTIYCNREIISAFKDVGFPKTKKELIQIANRMDDLSEASNIALNNLEDKTFEDLDEVCENVKIVCDLEIHAALKDLTFPASKYKIMDYIRSRDCSATVIQTLDDLPDEIIFKSIDDICK
jgi:hypothetical protein